MYARVSRYELPPGRVDEADAAFREALERIRALQGLERAILLLTRDGSRATTITLWDSESSMEVSRMSATSARRAAANAVGGEVISTEEFEVVFDVDGSSVGTAAGEGVTQNKALM